MRVRMRGMKRVRGIMPWRLTLLLSWLVTGSMFAQAADDERLAATRLRVQPAQLQFDFPESSEQLLVDRIAAAGGVTPQASVAIDLTRTATYSASPAGIVRITAQGQVVPLADGTATIQVQSDDQTAEIPVTVRGMTAPPPISFQRDIVPILTKASCNAGGCHGKAEGQNGFKLSVFGYDPAADHRALVMEGSGRRVFPASPDQSLLLKKGLATLPHGGGKKLEAGSRGHLRLRRWISEGVAFDVTAAEGAVAIAVQPPEVTLSALGTQQLRVVARFADGSQRCVTAEAEYQSNNDAIAGVDRDGWVTATEVPGEAAILVRYQGHVAICRVTRPRASGEFTRPPEQNFIDRLVWDKLAELRVPASPVTDDATFLRRVYLDTIGTLPTVAEAEQFLNDPAADKRSRLIAALLQRPEYTDYWTQRWCDLLQVDKDVVTPQAAVAMTRWVQRQIADNVRYDDFARAVITARGSSLSETPAAFYVVQRDTDRATRAVSQLFLGVRIECAQCHHHPFEKWDQVDYYAFAGFFTGLDRKNIPQGGRKIVLKPGTDLKHPRTEELVPAAGFDAAPADLTDVEDRRTVLAAWATSADNDFFKQTIVNRLCDHYFGRGLFDPVDDLRATNPASNPKLMQALTAHLVEVQFDLRAFTQTLLESRVYQLSSQAIPDNALDEQNYSHASWKPIPAEVLLDAVSQATGVPEEFNGWPQGYRAIQIWDNKLPSDFLQVFGRPSRLSVCACERGTEPSIAQALHLMNSEPIGRKIQHRHGRARRLAESDLTPAAIVRELYLATLSREPSAEESQLMQREFAESGSRQQATEDILWTLMNTKEFVFNR